MQKLIICRGLPASGKSTWAKAHIKANPGWKRVSRDDLRAMLDDSVWSKANEAFVVEMQNTLILAALCQDFNVILDNTHLNKYVVKKVHQLAQDYGDIVVTEKCFNVSMEEALERNSLRLGNAFVPPDVIRKMAAEAGLDRGPMLQDRTVEYRRPPSKAPYIAPAGPMAIICDLDGTLAHLNGRNPYDATHCDEDLPNWPVINCVDAMYQRDFQIIFMSGREEKYREPTERFLNLHFPHDSYSWELYMRATGDSRKDSIVKEELFEAHVREHYYVQFVLDDRQQVVDMWREQLGLTCLQVAEGRF